MWWTLSVIDEGLGNLSIFKKGFLSARKANEALITNLKVIAMRGVLLEVKDQDHHSLNGDRKFKVWLTKEAWNISGLFCIISGELILLIQCMKIRFIETFIKARGDLMSRENWEWDENLICQSLVSASAITWPFWALPFSSVKWSCCCFCLQWKFNGILEESYIWKQLAVLRPLASWLCRLLAVWEIVTVFSAAQDFPFPSLLAYLPLTSVPSSELG